ncbi:zf-HC2 domain-containing protein [Streptomyces durbertensis]|uniref:Zf-HC2 domain-containing protein n=1 Tax=Streptomyces durbertensis TaxID=2448886 RepID=A0ABR6ED33_9ACTN|nr:zf-HC2 domain-containing protein [Streptomyces durbertensis]MBB1242414.1 zf-HC2 domain-containing protein [Streptomyces durbertensis]
MPEARDTSASRTLDAERYAEAVRRERAGLLALAERRLAAGGSVGDAATGDVATGDAATEDAALGDAAVEELVAEAVFRVWREPLSPAALDLLSELLADAVRRPPAAERSARSGRAGSPGELRRAVRVLAALPRRQLAALWLAEAEELPPAAVARLLESNHHVIAALLRRARDNARREHLRAQPAEGAQPPECAARRDSMPAYVRGVVGEQDDWEFRRHLAGCAGCRVHWDRLERADERWPALLGPALLWLYVEEAPAQLAELAYAALSVREDPSVHAGSGRTPLRVVRRFASRAFG